jgi:hypothetical protein
MAMQHGDVKARLRDMINDHATAKTKDGKWAHSGDSYVDHDGDGTEGNVTYYCKGDLRQAPYEIGATAKGSAAGSIDFDNSKNVVPVTNYVPEAEDHENYAESDFEWSQRTFAPLLKAELYTEIPEYHERFISQKTRDVADSGSFAGKGKSFPILKAEDVSAALHSIGRAGSGNYSGDTIRANIKRIAKKKGFALPDSLKDSSDKESVPRETLWLKRDEFREKYGDASTWKPEGVLLCRESAGVRQLPNINEGAVSSYPIKLISPGRGSSGYYPPEVLKKAAESKVFKAGTQMFWNHDTDAEEAARPEGDLNRLAAITTTDARWDEAGKDGPGLYANAKVFSDYADKVKEMGPHIGLSIRAGGDRDEAAKGPDGKTRVITALRNAASVDFVTKAGRDGKIFTEGAQRHEGDDMDKNEVQALIRESLAPLQAENKSLREMLATVKAPALINAHLADIRLPDPVKAKIVEGLACAIPTDANGAVDQVKLKAAVEAKATEWAELLGQVGVGQNPASLGKRITEAEVLHDVKALDDERETVMEGLAKLFVGDRFVKGTVDEDKRQARKAARKAFQEGRAA